MKWENLTLKGALAFFLVCVAAFMVVLWMLKPPVVDAGTAALLASFVTMFIKMAADAIGYQYNSSSGSDKKDDTQAKVAGALADKVAPGVAPAALVAAPVAAVSAKPWWSLLTESEKGLITIAAANDPRVDAFIKTSAGGHGNADDLAYLVTKGLLTQDRANTIQAS